MARNKTTGQLITRIRELGEIRATYTTNAAIVDEIDQSRLELIEKLVSASASDYFEDEQLIDVVSGTSSYALPTGTPGEEYFQTLGVDIKLDNGDYAAIERYSFQDRNVYDSTFTSYIKPFRENYMYRIRGDNLVISPTPDYAETSGIRHIYVSTPAPLDNTVTNENVDGIHGWEDYIVYDCLVKFIGGKEEGDATEWRQMLGKANARIDKLKNRRDRANADTVSNVDYPFRRRRRRWGVSV